MRAAGSAAPLAATSRRSSRVTAAISARCSSDEGLVETVTGMGIYVIDSQRERSSGAQDILEAYSQGG